MSKQKQQQQLIEPPEITWNLSGLRRQEKRSDGIIDLAALKENAKTRAFADNIRRVFGHKVVQEGK